MATFDVKTALNMNTHKITNVVDPTNDQDAATKKYVDDNAGGGGATFGTPAIVLGSSAAAGSIDEVIRRDSTIVAFDATAPSTQAFGDSAATGSAAVAARRDHKHAMPTVEGAIHAASSKTTPDDADEFGIVDSAASNILKKLSGTNLKAYLKTYFDTLYTGSGTGIATDGWITLGALTYSSVDGATGVVTTTGDITGTVGVGSRVKFTQTTVKYFIVTAIDSTTMTIYGGTDYALVNAAITSPSWSPVKAPHGFPLDPAKWTLELTDTSNRSQASPTANTWYNLGSLSLDIHIGCWCVYYEAFVRVVSTTNPSSAYLTLSTANNSASDSTMQGGANSGATGAIVLGLNVHKERFLTLASKTTYFLNARTQNTGVNPIEVRGDVTPTIIRAVCAYL